MLNLTYILYAVWYFIFYFIERMRDLTSLEHTVGAPDYENVPDEPPELPLIGGNYENEGSIIE